MADYFIDSSAFVKYYVEESGSDRVKAILDPAAGNEIYIANITTVEVVAALNRCARRGDVREDEARSLIREFREEVASLTNIVQVTELIIEQATELASKYVIRGYDAVQLSVAMAIRKPRLKRQMEPLIIVSSDGELNVASGSEEFTVIDPIDG
ncbi:MAG: type II toxin-antitoxin system VapC family toxin [Candidatus Poribacteria bacterium]|nr:type II toxin-antitoxin system VapC family toxin [Candidatus Poribacteria bacterium]